MTILGQVHIYLTSKSYIILLLIKAENPQKPLKDKQDFMALPRLRQYIVVHCVNGSLEDVSGDSRVQQVMEYVM